MRSLTPLGVSRNVCHVADFHIAHQRIAHGADAVRLIDEPLTLLFRKVAVYRKDAIEPGNPRRLIRRLFVLHIDLYRRQPFVQAKASGSNPHAQHKAACKGRIHELEWRHAAFARPVCKIDARTG